jgi:hypothetical protein
MRLRRTGMPTAAAGLGGVIALLIAVDSGDREVGVIVQDRL